MKEVVVRHRRASIIVFQTLLVLVATYAAFWFRFDGSIPERYLSLYFWTAPIVVLVRGVIFIPFRLYEGYWRYASVVDLARIVVAIAASSLVLWFLLREGLGLTDFPRSVFLLDPILLIGMMSASRVSGRLLRELRRSSRERRLLIYGAGDAGEMVVRDLRKNPFYQHDPVGFIDDDPAKKGLRIRGAPVFGGIEDLPRTIEREKPDQILIAIPSAQPKEIRRIVAALEEFKIPILTLPNVRDLLSGRVSIMQARRLSYEDLLPRPVIEIDSGPVRDLVRGKRIMVTGAGGSIGSEICRQVLAHEPAALVLLDSAESALFSIDRELDMVGPGCPRFTLLSDVRRKDRIRALVLEHRPDVVFHAAAYKHVPLLEENPVEAVWNNVVGTRNVVEAALAAHVQRFVLISTDKAVNPLGVMGITKRLCELLTTARCGLDGAHTILSAVRFGNVLGSNGSVIPTFQAQIERGGPVTVTHPEISRYFMTIPEAVQLVLHAATLARGGDIFILDMGEQIRILELARTLIRAAGFIPDDEIEIAVTGLRPGEKLSEELVGEGEEIEPSGHEKISRLRAVSPVDHVSLEQRIDELEDLVGRAGGEEMRTRLLEIARELGEPWAGAPAGAAAG